MSSQQQTVGSRVFKSKSDLRSAIREIRDRYEAGSRVTNLADDELLRELVERHPERDDKVGCGIAFFTVEEHWAVQNGSSVGFSITRTDGSVIDFSFLTCVNGQKRTIRSRVHAAARTAVIGQIKAFANGRAGDVHHADPWPFVNIVDSFIEHLGFLPGLDDTGTHERFADRDTELEFAQWHQDRAILVLLSPEDHRKLRS